MPRDPAGTYTLPALGNPAVTGTPITIAWWNGTGTDLATALTNSFDRTGATGGMLGQFKSVDGSSSLPGLTFGLENNTGFYRATAGEMDVVVGGTRLSRWTVAGFQESFDNGITWKDPLYNNNGNQTFTGGLDFTLGSLTVGGTAVRGVLSTKTAFSSGTFTSTSTTYVAINGGSGNLAVTFTATGGPVLVQLIPDDSGNAAAFQVFNTSASATQNIGTVAFSTDGGSTFFAEQTVGGTLAANATGTTVDVPVSSVQTIYSPAAGTRTVSAFAKVFGLVGTPTVGVKYAKLVVTQF